VNRNGLLPRHPLHEEVFLSLSQPAGLVSVSQPRAEAWGEAAVRYFPGSTPTSRKTSGAFQLMATSLVA
jgi:hypothetical protein